MDKIKRIKCRASVDLYIIIHKYKKECSKIGNYVDLEELYMKVQALIIMKDFSKIIKSMVMESELTQMIQFK